VCQLERGDQLVAADVGGGDCATVLPSPGRPELVGNSAANVMLARGRTAAAADWPMLTAIRLVTRVHVARRLQSAKRTVYASGREKRRFLTKFFKRILGLF